MISCGIDFGTSNSSLALSNEGKIYLAPVEGAHYTIPSALFYESKTVQPYLGRAAVQRFFDRRSGRFMRSLKRVLGTSLMTHGTSINGKHMAFEAIIATFLKNLKQQAEEATGRELDHVVMGRPVHFIDHDTEGDARAQLELKNIAKRIGFTHIEFQFEPIAAAFAHEEKLNREKLAMVVDIGGGTSDFTIIRLARQHVPGADRSSDILANSGVRVGGNDFDKDLSLSTIMPELGYRSTYGDKHLEVPLKPFHDLAEWSKVNSLYTVKLKSQLQLIFHESHERQRFKRLLRVLEQETGHALLAATEEAKVALTSHNTYRAQYDFIEHAFALTIHRHQLEDAIRENILAISQCAHECLAQAGCKPEAIELVILTGGSSEVPAVQKAFANLFPSAAISDENKLLSVGLGLAYDARNKFGV